MPAHPAPAGSGVTVEDRRWLTAAIDLSRRCAPTTSNYAVGALVVDGDGTVLATGWTGELGPRDGGGVEPRAQMRFRRGVGSFKIGQDGFVV